MLLQIDNPMSILNQDTSRNFLHTQDPKDKYKVSLDTKAYSHKTPKNLDSLLSILKLQHTRWNNLFNDA